MTVGIFLSLRNAIAAAFVSASMALAAVPAQAVVITIDPGPVGSSMAADTAFNLPDLVGPVANGTLTVDVTLADNKYVDFSSLPVYNIILDLDFTNFSGSFGSDGGAFLDVNGDPIPGTPLGHSISFVTFSVNLNGFPPVPLAYGFRYVFLLDGVGPDTAISGASLNFFNGATNIGRSAVQAVPEPGTLALLGGGLLLGFAALRRERRRKAA